MKALWLALLVLGAVSIAAAGDELSVGNITASDNIIPLLDQSSCSLVNDGSPVQPANLSVFTGCSLVLEATMQADEYLWWVSFGSASPVKVRISPPYNLNQLPLLLDKPGQVQIQLDLADTPGPGKRNNERLLTYTINVIRAGGLQNNTLWAQLDSAFAFAQKWGPITLAGSLAVHTILCSMRLDWYKC